MVFALQGNSTNTTMMYQYELFTIMASVSHALSLNCGICKGVRPSGQEQLPTPPAV